MHAGAHVNYPALPQKLILALEGAALAPAPEVLLRLMRAVEDEGSSLADIADIVDKDPAIAARVLAAANSSAFHRGRSLISLEECLQVLGLRVVRSIAVCLSVQCVFARQADNARIDLSGFWYHSLLSAELARALALALAYPRPGEAYLGGLLHDLGELALLSALRDEYAQLLSQAADESNLSELEFGYLGATHAEVGAWLVDQWRLDSSLADSVLFHHASPVQIGEADLLARIIWCAHVAATAADAAPELAQVAALLQLPLEQINVQATQARERVVVLAEAMGIAVAAARPNGLPGAEFSAPLAATDPTAGLLESMAETAILQALQRDLQASRSAAGVLHALAESLRILFGVERVGFLRYSPADDLLSGVAGQHAALAGIRLPLATASSLAARALRERVLCGTHDGAAERSVTLADIQLCRALHSEGMLCLPLLLAGSPLGVLLLGTSASLQGRLRNRPEWLKSFARIAALGLEMASETPPDAVANVVAGMGREQQIKRFSHEVGNPLSIIKSYLKLLENKVPEESGMREELLVLKEEIDRVVRIVRELSEPATETPHSLVPLNEVVNDLVTLYGEPLFASRDIDLQLRLDPLRPQVQGDKDGIKQVLLNLLKNASEALTAGGSVQIETSAAMLDQGVRHAGFAIQDSGPGIPLAVVQRLYAPLPEQRNAPASRGMGLSIVGGLVRHMQGKVVCETRQGQGTRISVLLPPADGSIRAEGSN